ncbi:MAG: PD-(D/E)XK nuclease family protein, partial [Acidimicrobiia bacterium]
RYGEGVLCGTTATGLGLDLDAVFVLGVAEGIVPAVRREDALIAETDRVLAVDGELRTRDRSVADQRRSYLAALAAGADHRILSFARGDLRTTRDRLPSRFLLETASALRGERVFASDFGNLDRSDGVDVVASFPAGLRRVASAATVAEHDLGVLVQAIDAGADIARHPLTAAPAIAAGIEARRARASGTFTRWDGNVAAVAALVPSPATGEVVSATRLEQWSTCPFRYYLSHVLRIPVEDEPERLLEFSPLERGTLVHAVLERFVGEELAKPDAARVPSGEPWPVESSVLRLTEIVDELAADAEVRGLTGKAVLWSLHREEIASEVVQFLLSDNEWRMADGAVPESVEFPFGYDGTPPVAVTVPSGAVVRFRGRADRIDRRPDGTRVVLDYKTGARPRVGKGSADDPVWAGGRLQLPLYAEAARQALGAEQVEAAYWYVSQRGGFGRDEVELDERTSTRFREVVGQIVDGIDGGTFPAAPGEPSWFHGTDENCAYCDYNELCPVDRGAQYDAKESAPEFQVFHDLAIEAPE